MSTQLEPGSTFGQRYRIERFLAEGGFGAVYVAEQLATEAKVALKVLWPHVLESQDAVEKFQQEARIAGRVRSEHIVRVLDAGFDDATRMPFLTMELLHGEDLQHVVERSGPISCELVVVYLRQIASALDKAHQAVDKNGVTQPIVHRDLKPENLFLTHRDDGHPLVKVLDFGIAKVLSGTSNMSRDVKGTPLYMAYEQASGGPITPQTDIWALGLIAFFLLSGRAYWRAAHAEAAGLTQLFGEVLQLPIDPPTQRTRELGIDVPWPGDFDDWFLRCVHRDPSMRFPSAGAAADALASLGWPQPQSAFAATLAPVSGAVPIATPPYSIQSDRGTTRQSVTAQSIGLAGTIHSRPPPKRSAARWLAAAIGVVLVAGGLVVARLATRHAGPPAAVSNDVASGTPSSAAASAPAAASAGATGSATPVASAPTPSASPTSNPSAPRPRQPRRARTQQPSHARSSAPPKPQGSSKVLYGER